MGNLGKHSMVYGIGIVLTKAVSFLMLPIYTRFLTPADYGVLQLVTMTLEVVSIFAGSRIAFGIFHFYHKASDEAGRQSVLSTALLLLSTTYALAATAAIVLAPQIAELVFGEAGRYATYIRLAAASMAFESLIIVPTALFQLRDRSTAFVVVSLVRLVLQVALNLILLIAFDMGVTGVLLSSLITSVVVGGVLAVHVLVQVGARFRTAHAREFLRFGLPLVAVQVATFVYTFGDRYFLNRAGGEEAVGLYGLAYQFGFLVATLGFAPFQRVWDPQRFAVAKRPDRDAIYARVFIYLNVGLISASLGISLFSGDVLRLIAAPAFHAAAVYVPIIVIAYVLHCWGNFLNLGIFIKERTEYYTVANWAAAIVAVIGYVLLIPRWLAWGAAIATLASVAVRFWLAFAFSQRLWPIRYEWGPVVRLLLVASAFGLLSALLPLISLPASLAIHVLMFAAYAVLVWRVLLSDADKDALRRFVSKRRGSGTASMAP
jgi:O-antigen/teichoic acid export membrane protein